MQNYSVIRPTHHRQQQQQHRQFVIIIRQCTAVITNGHRCITIQSRNC